MSYSEFIETPRDLAEALADMLGIQNNPDCMSNKDPERGFVSHECDNTCRLFWVTIMAQRITDAVLSNYNLDKACQETAAQFWWR